MWEAPAAWPAGGGGLRGWSDGFGLARLLVEAAWHRRPAYRIEKTMRARWELAGPAARTRADEGNRRLHHRWKTMRARHKRNVIANVAIARELAGWCWSLAVIEE